MWGEQALGGTWQGRMGLRAGGWDDFGFGILDFKFLIDAVPRPLPSAFCVVPSGYYLLPTAYCQLFFLRGAYDTQKSDSGWFG